jgi:hypothetical protein
VGGIALGVSLAVGLLLGASLVGSPADEYSLGVSLAPVYSGPVEKPHLDPD